MNTPRNIIAIDRVPASSLLGYQRTGVKSVKVDNNTLWQSLSVKVPARLTISDKIDNGVRIYTAQLVFRSCEELTDLARWAYRCKTADGKFYLIGTDERPYPVGTVTTNHPDNMTDNQLSEVTVNYTSGNPIPYIL